MNRSWPVLELAIMLCLFAPGLLYCQADPLAMTAATGTVPTASMDLPAPVPEESPDIPQGLQDLMRSAQKRYLEGSNLIKSGESARARVEFNKAVDMLLESQWKVASNRDLNRFFQDLIRRIQQDESRYLQSEELPEDKSEQAVVDELAKLNLIPIKIDPKLKGVVEADLANTKYDIPITLNEAVLQSLNYWLNRGRKYFQDGLQRSGRYKDMIQRTFREESVPLDLMYLAQVESLFKPNALSRAKAKGIWQFGRLTAMRYGLKVNNSIDERSDPEKSTRAAARYLNDLYAMFKDWDLVLAAYNWGEGKVQRLIDKSGLNDFWELRELRRRNFPRETKKHVPLIQASVILARNPEKYGFSKEFDPAEIYDLIPLSRAIDLRAAARILNTSLDDLKRLNPALRGLTTPADYPDFRLKVPPGSDPELRLKVAELPAARFKPPSFESPGRYRIQQGDTLGKIAAHYHTSVSALQEANAIRSPKALRVGSYLRVPTIPQSSARSAVPHRRVINKPINLSVRKSASSKPAPAKPKVSSASIKRSSKANN